MHIYLNVKSTFESVIYVINAILRQLSPGDGNCLICAAALEQYLPGQGQTYLLPVL